MTQGARDKRGWRVAGRLGLLLLAPVLAGCGGSQGTVSGKVIYKNKGLPGGRITFRPVDSRLNPVTVSIDPDGNYEAKLPLGQMLIGIDNSELAPPPARKGAAPAIPGLKLPRGGKPDAPSTEPSPTAPQKLPGPFVYIPVKYYDPYTSELKFTVEKGSQPHDIELK